MGIKDLTQFLRKTNPRLFATVPIGSFAGHRIAIDASIYLFKYICVFNAGRTHWIDLFINLVSWLRKHNIRPIFIFDGPPPELKEKTQQQRRKTRDNTQEKINKLAHFINVLRAGDGDGDDDTIDILGCDADMKQQISELLKENLDNLTRTDVIVALEVQLSKEQSRCIRITEVENRTLQSLLDHMGLPWYKASGEAEKTCSWLCKYGHVRAVMTTDSDVLAYGAPIYIKDIQISDDTCLVASYEDILESLQMTPSEFTDFCIMLGTDYNQRIPKCGCVQSMKLISQHKNIENIGIATGYNVKDLLYEECRQLFALPPPNNAAMIIQNCCCNDGDEFKIAFLKSPNIDLLRDLLQQNNSTYDVNAVLRKITFRPTFEILGDSDTGSDCGSDG